MSVLSPKTTPRFTASRPFVHIQTRFNATHASHRLQVRFYPLSYGSSVSFITRRNHEALYSVYQHTSTVKFFMNIYFRTPPQTLRAMIFPQYRIFKIYIYSKLQQPYIQYHVLIIYLETNIRLNITSLVYISIYRPYIMYSAKYKARRIGHRPKGAQRRRIRPSRADSRRPTIPSPSGRRAHPLPGGQYSDKSPLRDTPELYTRSFVIINNGPTYSLRQTSPY